MEADSTHRVIDVHCHLFNARYLPLKGVLEGLGVPGWLSEVARDILNELTADADLVYAPGLPCAGTADGGEEEAAGAPAVDAEARSFFDVVRRPGKFPTWQQAFRERAARELSRRVAASRAPILDAAAAKDRDRALTVLEEDDLYVPLERVRRLYLERVAGALPEKGVSGTTELLEALEASEATDEQETAGVAYTWSLDLFGPVLDWVLDQLNAAIAAVLGVDAAEGYIQFLLLMLSSETQLYQEMLGTYAPEQNVDLSVHLMMDMQHGYGDEQACYPFDSEQIDRMAALVQQSNGRLRGFVAFDPRRENGLELVREALQKCSTGVKLYPPMGYRATGEDENQREALRELYAYCTENDVPILTHCSPVGFEADAGLGVKSSPEHWDAVLADFPGLRLCYGHAGGDVAENIDPVTGATVTYPGWLSDPSQWADPRNFSRMVAEHCAKYEHVYCDFSYLTAIVDDAAGRANFVANLEAALVTYDGDYALGDKIMYGSDWHMPSMAAGAGDFLEVLMGVFEEPQLHPYRDRFFSENAARFLRLGVPVSP